VHRGEIVGLFGLVGAGRTELAKALFGAWDGMVEGEVAIDGREGRPSSPRDAIGRGLGMLTEDRKQTGLIDGQSVSVNISAASLAAVCGRLFIDHRRERERNEGLVRRLDVRPPRLAAPINGLSGGNQQKALLARWLATRPKLLIIDEPTLGVDIGARLEMYRLIRELADTGCGVLMISSDLNEIREESDRILVMYKGRITGAFEHAADRLTLMAAATGEQAST
jgi:ABC-type sugar transport system ATPase subunit